MLKSNDLKKIAESYDKGSKKYKRRIILCAGTGCVANGVMKIHDKLVELLKKNKLEVDIEFTNDERDKDVLISRSGCQGFCQMGPLMNIFPDNILYNKVQLDDVEDIVEKTLIGNEVIDRLLYESPQGGCKCKGENDIPFYSLQERTILKQCGHIDPNDIEEYISLGGYQAAAKVYQEMTAAEVCTVAMDSGLRGRGGGGFPAGRKWELTRVQESEKKFVICNGDEGDPGAFMDRSLLEGAPHSVIEGMLIAARAIGADEGYFYIRMEYPLAVDRVRKAVEDAERLGVIGENIFGTKHSFKIHVMEGAGAFVCGEETALMASIVGQRGMPLPKPPFPAESGLFGKPTVINNVETLASVPYIFREGVETYRARGTENSPGTKTFALTGHVANTGLIEVPFGTTLRKIIFDIGGGVTDKDGNVDNSAFKAVQIGGPSGACLTEEHLDLPLDFDSLTSIGAMVGSGGLVVMNKDTCMVKVARFFMQFTQNESCGKCVLCREGTKQMLAMLDDIIEGNATENTLLYLDQVSQAVKKGSLCGLGKTAPNPVLATIKYFGDEVRSHVVDKICPTKECKNLTMPEVIAELCKGCTLCARKCPVDAISGGKKEVHVIDEEKCIRCGACIDACKFKAIV